jgi:hypothetical protein
MSDRGRPLFSAFCQPFSVQPACCRPYRACPGILQRKDSLSCQSLTAYSSSTMTILTLSLEYGITIDVDKTSETSIADKPQGKGNYQGTAESKLAQF